MVGILNFVRVAKEVFVMRKTYVQKLSNNTKICSVQAFMMAFLSKVVIHKKVLSYRSKYTITINHQLSIYTSMKHSLLSLKLLVHVLNSLEGFILMSDTVLDVRIKAFTLLF